MWMHTDLHVYTQCIHLKLFGLQRVLKRKLPCFFLPCPFWSRFRTPVWHFPGHVTGLFVGFAVLTRKATVLQQFVYQGLRVTRSRQGKWPQKTHLFSLEAGPAKRQASETTSEANLPVTEKRAISGHSMGGHGALTIGLKNPDRLLGLLFWSRLSRLLATLGSFSVGDFCGIIWKSCFGLGNSQSDRDPSHTCICRLHIERGIAPSPPLLPFATPWKCPGDRRPSAST